MSRSSAVLAACAAASPALAQLSNVAPETARCWAENVGWLNWRDAGSPPASQGAYLAPTVLAGFVWSENVGWINLGDGLPDNGAAYSNTSGADSGVNLSASGELSGMAWGENIGWINFGAGAAATPPNPARFDSAERRLRGYAWSENVGWINLDHAVHYVGFLCPSDFDQNGWVNGDDFDAFMLAFFAGEPEADFDHNSWVNGDDFDFFVAAFDAGC